MTREQKIQNILKATQDLMEEKAKSGELTPEMSAAILECQNSAIAAVNCRETNENGGKNHDDQ